MQKHEERAVHALHIANEVNVRLMPVNVLRHFCVQVTQMMNNSGFNPAAYFNAHVTAKAQAYKPGMFLLFITDSRFNTSACYLVGKYYFNLLWCNVDCVEERGFYPHELTHTPTSEKLLTHAFLT